MHKIIFVLSGLLFLVGSALFFSGATFFPPKGSSFETQAIYEEARGKGELPVNAPDLPTCATEVKIEKDDAGVTKLSFLCAERQMRDAYVAEVKNNFTWNVFIQDGDRVEIERAAPRS